ncbi:MAG: methylenetetrahydrofolate--tRNA-(uracil(54)-C(5))-methyltransferase (FADH(2)-oxidizing) TrmFO [Anaerolineae bacterium]
MGVELTVVGGGLAGSEAAWQAAQRGLDVNLYEMRPVKRTPAHVTDHLAELVCSNSLGSNLPDRAPGLLKAELRRLGSLILDAAQVAAVPAGGALAVDRDLFAATVTERVSSHPRITIHRQEVTQVPDAPSVIATGPLTSPALSQDIARLTGQEHLYFYDAMAPIVTTDSIDMAVAFRGSRYDRGESEQGDYVNCPLDEDEYYAFVRALTTAQTAPLRQFEREDAHFFEGCLPVEEMARRGERALAFGPLRPVGLTNPHNGRRPFAVVQLRQDNLAGTLYNMVGFQTNLRWGEQDRVFRMIPGLARAEFVRYGQMHRNTFINAPTLLEATMQFRTREDLLFAGQITGVEGYVGNTATGWVAGVNAARLLWGQLPVTLPVETVMGALCHYITHADPRDFQPMKANFGLIPPLSSPVRHKRERYRAYADRSLRVLDDWIVASGCASRSHDGDESNKEKRPSLKKEQ